MMTPEQIAAMQRNNAGEPFDGPLSSAQALRDAKAEIARLNEMLAVQWEGIPWRDGPPPAEWRDGREVLLWAKNAHHVRWGAGSWHVVNGSGAQIVQSMITHHAAVTAPHEKGQPG